MTVDREARLEEARQRALIITEHIREHSDLEARQTISGFAEPLEFAARLEDLAIAPEAWDHITNDRIDPRLVFAHPDLLRAHPQTSIHYRGISTLSLKRVQSMATQVKAWEDGTLRRPPTLARCLNVARTYNAVISVIITGTDGWTLENGYRNILATIGITEDGALRNIVGQEGEAAVKGRISEWLDANDAITTQVDGTMTLLGDDGNLRMIYGSEPDISFESGNEDGEWQIIATVEIKSGTDPAGALERLGAIQKSFAETPARARNFAVLGVVTPEMRRRLDEMNVARDFSLYRILTDEGVWDDFVGEIFHTLFALSNLHLDQPLISGPAQLNFRESDQAANRRFFAPSAALYPIIMRMLGHSVQSDRAGRCAQNDTAGVLGITMRLPCP